MGGMMRGIGCFAALSLAAALGLAACTPAETRDLSTEPAETQEVATEPAVPTQAAPVPVGVMGRDEQDPTLMLPRYTYTLASVHEVDGRQGIAWDDGVFFVSGSTTLSRYDASWNMTETNDQPFEGIESEVNHLGDIDAYDGKIYAGVENFLDGEATNIQIVVYDAETLKPLEAFPFEPDSGQTEVSGIAVDPDTRSVWMCSWTGGESGPYLYRYDLETGDYLGKVHLQAPPQWIQGVAYHDGCLYLTADDGIADEGEPDHVWRCKVDLERTAWHVALERTLDDVTLQGEVEGLSFDRDKNQMLVSYNRGAQIVLGMPKGFYEGYESEIHEVFVYDMTENESG